MIVEMLKTIKYIIVLFVLINSVLVCHATMQKGIDRKKIIKTLEEAYQRDQAPRLIIDSLMRSGVTDGNLYLPAITQQREADSINIKVVLPIIDTLYKFEIYDLDTIAYEWCWIIIQHANNDVMVGYTDFIEELANRDLISKSSYMKFVDRLEVRNERAQIYGYQFHRLANGTMIQYPILKGREKRWKKLGCEYKMNSIISADYIINYYATEIEKDQFVCIGFIFEGERDSSIENCTPVVNAKILLNKRVVAVTDSCGYFSVIMNKKKLPSNIEVLINGMPIEYKIEQNKDKDFSISVGYFKNGRLDVISE